MLRCNDSAGDFIVTMLHSGEEERRQLINAHADIYEWLEVPNTNPLQVVQGKLLESAPIISSVNPYAGELCTHEVALMKESWRYISPELFFNLQAG